MNIEFKKNQQKVPGPPPKLSASHRRTCENFQHWRQAIIWTNADLIHLCIYAALGGDELTSLNAIWNKTPGVIFIK